MILCSVSVVIIIFYTIALLLVAEFGITTRKTSARKAKKTILFQVSFPRRKSRRLTTKHVFYGEDEDEPSCSPSSTSEDSPKRTAGVNNEKSKSLTRIATKNSNSNFTGNRDVLNKDQSRLMELGESVPSISVGLANKEKNEYFIEEVLDYRIKNGEEEYLVKWEGWPA